MSVVQGVLHGGRTGGQIGAIGGPWGIAAGVVIGGIVGGAAMWWVGDKLADGVAMAVKKGDEDLSGENEEDCTGECDTLPDNPDDLLGKGWEETSHPDAKESGRRTFKNPETGEELIFDEAKPGRPGWRGQDHYHRPNPNATSRHDEYLDINGNPVGRNSPPSHIRPGSVLGRGTGGAGV